jgi:hypothetical protein
MSKQYELCANKINKKNKQTKNKYKYFYCNKIMSIIYKFYNIIIINKEIPKIVNCYCSATKQGSCNRNMFNKSTAEYFYQKQTTNNTKQNPIDTKDFTNAELELNQASNTFCKTNSYYKNDNYRYYSSGSYHKD